MSEGFNLGVALAGGRISGKRHEDDFYRTEEAATRAFLAAEGERLKAFHVIQEPACGDGAIARILKAEGFDVLATDLRDRGYGVGGQNYLEQHSPCGVATITNPPFNLAEEFIRHALIDLKAPYLALLLKATFFHTANRLPLWDVARPSIAYGMAWRLDFTGGGRGTMDCSWFVWDADRPPPCRYEMLSKPRSDRRQGVLHV